LRGGLRNKNALITLGAQTERRDDAGPVRALPGGMTSPAALLHPDRVLYQL